MKKCFNIIIFAYISYQIYVIIVLKDKEPTKHIYQIYVIIYIYYIYGDLSKYIYSSVHEKDFMI